MSTTNSALLPLPADDDTLIRRADVQAYLGIAPQTLARWAHEGQGPRFIKMGGKLVAYRAGDLRSWLETCQRSSTTQT